MSGHRRGWSGVGLAIGLLAVGAAVAVELPAVANRITVQENRVQQQFGTELAVSGIFLEETGVPMPVPSEVSIGYVGDRLRGNVPALLAAWVGLTALIVLGSTNLFTLARRLGPRLLGGRVGDVLHLTRPRVQRAERWFRRWGLLAIVASRYVPGLRWAMAVACGTLGVSYRTFWLGTAISASIWTGVLLTIGVTVGDAVGRTILAHPWLALLLPVPALAVVTTTVVRLVLQRLPKPSAVTYQ